jgi:hypothetical protein
LNLLNSFFGTKQKQVDTKNKQCQLPTTNNYSQQQTVLQQYNNESVITYRQHGGISGEDEEAD